MRAEEEIIARAIAGLEVPREDRRERYGNRTPEQILADLNHNWDVTRALLKTWAAKEQEIAALKQALKAERRIRKVLTGLISAELVGTGIALAKIFLGLSR